MYLSGGKSRTVRPRLRLDYHCQLVLADIHALDQESMSGFQVKFCSFMTACSFTRIAHIQSFPSPHGLRTRLFIDHNLPADFVLDS
jgi:hypothetical protein